MKHVVVTAERGAPSLSLLAYPLLGLFAASAFLIYAISLVVGARPDWKP